jgi:glycosidase
MDFPLQDALVKGLTEGDIIYTDGLIKMYEMLANDFLYADPYRNVIFADNHDMNRFYTQVSGDLDLFKMGMAYILTMRGIPQVYYGTEVLLKSPVQRDDGLIRLDFPGGWAGDAVNAFNDEGLSADQLEAKYFMKKLLEWRKTMSCIHSGRLTHYNPDQGTYTYFRYDEKDTVMVVFNKNLEEFKMDTDRYSEVLSGKHLGKEVISGAEYDLGSLVLPPRSVLILQIF